MTPRIIVLSCLAALLANGLQGQSTSGVVRWTVSSGRQLYHADSVALGDNCGTAIVGKNFRDSGVEILSATTPTRAFEIPSQHDTTVVAAAEYDSLVARAYARQLAGSTTVVGAVEAYESWTATKPLWRYDYPFRNNGVPIRPFLFLSRDGKRVVATWGDFVGKRIVVESFRRDGSSLSSTVISGTWSVLAADASDDATTIGLRLASGLAIVNTVAGIVEFQIRLPGGASSMSDSISVSGDGRRVAYGKRLPGEVGVLDRGRNWAAISILTFGDVYLDYVDLNADGERLAFAVQDRKFLKFDTVLYDLPSARRLFTRSTSAPLSIFQLVAAGIEVDDAGNTVAIISWGDSDHITPEVQCYDQSGRTVYSQKTRGSGLAMDLSPDGKVLLVGNSSKHHNVIAGPGGDVHYVDLEAPGLDIRGLARAGQIMKIRPLPAAGNSPPLLVLGLARLPAPWPAPFEGWLLDPAAIAAIVPLARSQELSLTVPAGHAGLALHWQAASATAAGAFDASTAITTRIVR